MKDNLVILCTLIVALIGSAMWYHIIHQKQCVNKIIFVQQNNNCNPKQYDNAKWEQLNDSTIIRIK